VQSDPIGLDGGENSYTYSSLNPVLYFDVKGLCLASTSGENDQMLLARLMNAEARASETIATGAHKLWQAIRAYMAIGFVVRNRIKKGHGFKVYPPGSPYTYYSVICREGQFANGKASTNEAARWNEQPTNHAMGAAWNVLNDVPDITHGATSFRYRDYANHKKDETAIEDDLKSGKRKLLYTRKIANRGEWIFVTR